MEESSNSPDDLGVDISSPRPNDKVFTYYWNIFVEDITKRSNFKLGHLQHLDILCGLYSEYKSLTDTILEEGYFYDTVGRYGHQQKANMAVTIREKILTEIRQFSRMLGILLVKDEPNKGASTGEWA